MFEKYIIGGVILVGLAGGAIYWHTNSVSKAVEAARSSVKQQYDATYVQGLETSLTASNKLLQDSNTAKEKLANEKKIINGKLASAIGELSKRPTRQDPSPINPTTTVGETCSGALLPREDAEFLTREAARSDRILKERDDYYERYEGARQALEAFKGSISR